MKFKDAKDTVMQLINMYSERGIIFSSNDKNIADFEIKARNYLNIAMKMVSNRYPHSKNYEFTKTAGSAPQSFSMPSTFLRIEKMYKIESGEAIEYTDYTWSDDKTIIMPASASGSFRIRYASLSTELSQSTSSQTDLDIQPALENAVCYYAAAMLIQSERPEIATRLLEQYTELMVTYAPNSKKLQRKIKRV